MEWDLNLSRARIFNRTSIMLRRVGQKRTKGQSLVEYIVLIAVVLGAFLVFQKYMARGFAGRWKSVGESMSQGRIYDPLLTTECIFSPSYSDLWYDKACFESSGCDCLSGQATTATCRDCIAGCASIRCNS